jgi:hypothetical protein
MAVKILNYTCWVNGGCEGWHPYEYDTLEEALKHESYGSEKCITRYVVYEIVEKENSHDAKEKA